VCDYIKDNEPDTEPESASESESAAEPKAAEEAAEEAAQKTEPETMPKATVIAFFNSPDDEMEVYLEEMERQDYPNFDVFIVIKGNARQAEALHDSYKERFPRAKFSFIPPESHNLSLKKLAYTLGVKSTDSEVIVTSLPECRYASERWLSRMMRHFENPEIGVVLGYADFNYGNISRARRGYRHFSSLVSNMEWVSEAVNGNPYRGYRANLAFRKSLFFENNGYGKSYFLHTGDDDLFVSDIATSANTVVEMGLPSQAVVECGGATSRMWVDHKESYGFTSHYLKRYPRKRYRIGHIMNWMAVILLVAAALCGLPSLIPAISAAVVLVVYWLWQGAAYNGVAAIFGDKKRWSTAPMLYLYRPFADIAFNVKYHSRGVKNFTWQRKSH
jgi:hypothetical protein